MQRRGNEKGRILPACAAAILLSGMLFGCGSTRQGKETEKGEKESLPGSGSTAETISTGEAVELIAALEQNPLSPDASAQRTILTAWVVASPDVGPLTVDDDVIAPFRESDHPYSPELFLQYMFGMARAQATNDHSTPYAVIESGVRSLLAAYKSITLMDSGTHNPFLDNLDYVRRQGKLEEYIRGVEDGR